MGRRSRAGNYRWWAGWSGAPWGGQLGRQREPRWVIQMVGGVKVRWADGAALGSTDGGRVGEERRWWADGAALGSTDSGWSIVERHGMDS